MSKVKIDSAKVELLGSIIAEELDDKVWMIYNDYLEVLTNQCLRKPNLTNSEKIHYQSAKLTVLSNRGFYFDAHSQYEKSKLINERVINLGKQIKDTYAIANAYSNLGVYFLKKGIYKEAINNFKKALFLQERFQGVDNRQTSHTLTNLSVVFSAQKMYDKALIYAQKSLEVKLDQEILDSASIAHSMNVIGNLYAEGKNIKMALKYWNNALQISEKIGDNSGMASAKSSLGKYYMTFQDFEKGKKMLLEAKSTFELIPDYLDVCRADNNLGKAFYENGRYKEALNYLKMAYNLAVRENFISDVSKFAKDLYLVYKKLNEYEKSYLYLKIHNETNKKINNKEIDEELISAEIGYEYEKKKIASDFRNKINTRQAKQQRTYVMSGIFGLSALITAFLISLLINNRNNKLMAVQKIELEHKSAILEEKQLEIEDSINYSKRLQESVLASETAIAGVFDEYFILFKPKEVISGDFYWTGKLQDNKYAFMVGDSSGTGVQGSIMSMLNIQALENAIEVEKLIYADEILNQTRATIVHVLNSGKENKISDGMDCTFLTLDESNFCVEYTGAKNNIICFRENELLEFEVDNFSLGDNDSIGNSFSRHTISLQKNDMVYLFTDGFYKQIGGEENTELSYVLFKNLLSEIQFLEMHEQQAKLENHFENWKKNNPQTDDITILGWKVKGKPNT